MCAQFKLMYACRHSNADDGRRDQNVCMYADNNAQRFCMKADQMCASICYHVATGWLLCRSWLVIMSLLIIHIIGPFYYGHWTWRFQ